MVRRRTTALVVGFRRTQLASPAEAKVFPRSQLATASPAEAVLTPTTISRRRLSFAQAARYGSGTTSRYGESLTRPIVAWNAPSAPERTLPRKAKLT
jgi:hypothetical protein